MKSKEIIEDNLKAKLGIYLTGVTDLRLVEHIRMLDWVLIEGPIRNINDIVKERCG
jgi:hypothetical protein